MWPTIADLGIFQITAWGLSLTVGFIVGSFSLWRKLRDDFDGEQILSLWLWLVVAAWVGSGSWACAWFRVCLPPLVAINGALVLAIGILLWWSKKRRWNFWELLDAFGPVSLGLAVLGAIGWGPVEWLTVMTAVVGVILAAVIKSAYRDFGWYKSGKTGFVGTIALAWWGVVQLVVANFTQGGLYSLGWIVVVCITVLYLRSGRKFTEDLSNIWPIKKA